MHRIKNELNFVLVFNNKKVKELTPLLRKVVEDIYYDINEDDVIKAWRNHKKQKTDLFLKINGMVKGININMRSRNSIHVEHISEFCNFLYELGATEELVKKYIACHYADGTLNGKGIERQSLEQYKKFHQDDIDELNNFLNTNINVSKALDRFVLKGTNSDYKIDGIIYGTPDDFLWIKRSDIIKIIFLNKDKYCSAVHFGALVCQPLNRCLNYNPRYSYGRYYVQVKWYSLFDDILETMYYLSFFNIDNMDSINF